MNSNKIFWNANNTPEKLNAMLQILSEDYPLIEGQSDDFLNLTFSKSPKEGISSVVFQDDHHANIEYAEISQAARAVGSLLAGLKSDEKNKFKTLGVMFDCSRNAVMNISYLKKWLRQLALMGYNMAMLYTEDTYKLPDEPFFGYLRGGYSLEEMQEIDVYAAKLGIEMIACIQTLGHLGQILQWDYYNSIKDTEEVLLVDEPRTYELIEKMLNFWSNAFSSRRIHIGMDEAHDLGRGRFLDKFGYQNTFDIFNRHLSKVSKLCANYNFKPIIWSDMYFRMGNDTNEYYREDTVIPDSAKKAIPDDIDLVYWDYYHKDAEFYENWIKHHRELGHEPLMASGIWTWARLWYDHNLTKATVTPCLEACSKLKLKEVLFTIWGNEGAYCDFDSAMTGLCYAAELSFNSEANPCILERRFKAICHASYEAYIRAADIHLDTVADDQSVKLIWDDPLLAIAENDFKQKNPNAMTELYETYQKIKLDLENYGVSKNDNLIHAVKILDLLIAKIDFRQKLIKAYSPSYSRKAIEEIINLHVPQIIKTIEQFLDSLRTQWMRRNKPFGFETLQIRFFGLIGRYKEVAQRLNELLEGKIDSISELDEKIEYKTVCRFMELYQTFAIPSKSL